MLDVWRQGAKVGQPIILFRTSNADPAEDFTISFQGTVGDFFAAGLVSAAVNFRYCGWLPALRARVLALRCAERPVRGHSHHRPPGRRVSLQPCGVSSKTV